MGAEYHAPKMGAEPDHPTVTEGNMEELKLLVPTYLGRLSVNSGVEIDADFGDPHVPVLVHSADGVRVVLATHDYLDVKTADIQIERRPNGWAIFLHPVGGGDPCGYVYFLDDGTSFLVPEAHGATGPIQVLDPGDDVSELDWPAATFVAQANSAEAIEQLDAHNRIPGNYANPAAFISPPVNIPKLICQCARCGQRRPYWGDWYSDFCPECADATDSEAI